MKQLAGLWQDAEHQWRANPRLRVVTYLAVVVALFGCYLKVVEWKGEQVSEAAGIYKQLVEARGVAGKVEWLERQKQASARLALAERNVWNAPSEGAAQALFRDVLARIAKSSGVDLGRLALTTHSLEELGLTEVRAEFRGDYKAGRWQTFLENLSEQRPLIRFDFEQLVREEGRRHTWRMAVSAVFDIGPGEG